VGITPPVNAPPAGECTPGMQRPQAAFTNIGDGSQVSGVVTLTGTALGADFNRYQLEIASLNNPEAYVTVAGPFNTQQNNGTLGQLAVFSNTGGYLYRTVQVGVNNVAPTVTPPILLPPTVDPGATLLPIPLNSQAATAIPTAGSGTFVPMGGLSNIPTPTLDFGG
jgi:hypothetical protein